MLEKQIQIEIDEIFLSLDNKYIAIAKILTYCWAINDYSAHSYLQVSLDLVDEQTINLFFIYKIPSHSTKVSC